MSAAAAAASLSLPQPQLHPVLPPPVGETPPTLEATRRPAPRHRDSPKHRLFFMRSSRSNNNNNNIHHHNSHRSGGALSSLRGGVASIAAEETAAHHVATATAAGASSSLIKSAAAAAASSNHAPAMAARRIAIRRSTMEHATTAAAAAAGDDTTTTATAHSPLVHQPIPTNVVQWLQYACPSEILPKVLAFCGPQKSASLMKTNRFWYHLITNDATWRVVCEETYKWKEGDRLPTTSWREYYRLNPCVPVDYSTIHKAMMVACPPPVHAPHHHSMRNPPSTHFPQRQSIRILLRPGKHYVKESIVIHSTHDVLVSMETMEMPSTLYQGPLSTATARASNAKQQVPESATVMTRSNSRRQVLQRAASFHQLVWNGCRSNHAVDETDDHDNNHNHDVDLLESPSLEEIIMPSPSRVPHEEPPKRATVIMRTRRHNEPILRVRQGHLKVSRLDLHHTSYGIDIWNGNAAVQVQPPMVSEDLPMAVDPRPSIELDSVEVISRSGRGIVNIDGGYCSILNCYVHDCAATGIYVGGPGTQAHIENTDVVQNGNGNRSSRRSGGGGGGIGRGHSGIYLEQGHALIRNCNISRNSLTGVSAISPDNAFLSLEGSDLIANGTFQLEMPNLGSVSRRRSMTRDNHLSVVGLARSRSGLMNPPNHHHQGDDDRAQ